MSIDRAAQWASANVPGEDPFLAAVAGQMLKRNGRASNPQAIRDHLQAQGRDTESLRRHYPQIAKSE